MGRDDTTSSCVYLGEASGGGGGGRGAASRSSSGFSIASDACSLASKSSLGRGPVFALAPAHS